MLRKLFNAPSHLSSWNKLMRRTYWGISLVSALAVLTTWAVVGNDQSIDSQPFFEKQVVMRNSLILGILLAAELIYRLKSWLQDYIIITLGSCYGAITLGLSSTEVQGTQIVMILPILVSILHFNYGKVLFSCFSTMITYLIVLNLVPEYRYGVPIYQKAVGFSFLIVVTLAALGIVNRGLQMMKDEKNALRNEKKHRILQQAVQEASSMDALTGLANHKTFQEQLRTILADEEERPLHLAIIDIDNFKSVNDTYGHAVGDTVLRKVGRLIRDCTQEGGLPSRYGGEEFTIIFTRMNAKAVVECLERLLIETEQLQFPEMEGRKVTISIGCHTHQENECRDVLFQLADEALYSAKRNGKNRISW
ncbi:GGDEF domain-containing protein [Paenibacillus sp. LPE1-1-1.1]|uniref:GGDEF domain-containing protein n=1 Tax=Paenibacillus sp. LPE1-1-1.1 TaxID=3135230 RepID=UPI00341522E8